MERKHRFSGPDRGPVSMASPGTRGTAAAGNAAASVQLDAEDELMLARFGAAGGAHLFEYADKEETQGKKGKAHRIQRRVKRDHRNKRALSDALDARSRP